MKFTITSFAFLFFAINGLSTFKSINNQVASFSQEEPILVSNENLSILTLNTWGLPVWYPKSNKGERYNDVIEFINNSKYDILSLQEVFDRKLINKIIKDRPTQYYMGSDYNCKRSSTMGISMDCHGGLMTLSKYPILDEKFYLFPINDEYKMDEKIGRKGFLVSTILTPKCTLTVINTHLYSGSNANDEKHRLGQIKYMETVMKNAPQFTNGPILLLGDLNIQHPSTLSDTEEEKGFVYEYVKKQMQFNDFDEEISEEEYTYDNTSNRYAPNKGKKQKIDYVMAKSSNDIQINEVLHKVVCKHDHALSDHNGLLSILEFKVKNNSSKAVVTASR
jgi:endonuclease/exonuclease/phosphatase family metal-dependent hydrolase